MSDWQPRLIASDMDGTLLHWDDTVSEETVAELDRWRADGVPIVLATGRPPRWMRRIREVLRLRAPRSAATAPCCSTSSGSRCSRRSLLTPEILAVGHCRAARGGSPDTWFAVEYGLEFRHEPIYKPRWDVDAPGVAEATLEEMVPAPVAKLLARHEELARDEFVAARRGRHRRPRDGHPLLQSDALAEISAAGVTKAVGLAKVAAQHGVGPEDVVVFGDMPNDIAAFEWVRAAGGRAVAMAHAHPDLHGRGHRRHRHQRRRRGRRVPANRC